MVNIQVVVIINVMLHSRTDSMSIYQFDVILFQCSYVAVMSGYKDRLRESEQYLGYMYRVHDYH